MPQISLARIIPYLTLSLFVFGIASTVYWVLHTQADLTFVYEQRQDYPTAIRKLKQLLAENPSEKKAADLARLYVKNGDPETAEQLYLSYTLPLSALEQIIEGYRAQGKYEDLRRVLLKKQSLAPSIKAVPQELISLYQLEKNYHLMIEQTLKLISLEPNNSGDYQQLGELYFLIGEDQKGLEAYAMRAQLQNNLKTWKELAQLYLYKKMTTTGIQIFQTLAEKYNEPGVWKELGDVYFSEGMEDKGVQAYIRRAELKDDFWTWRELAELYFYKQRPNEALAIYGRLANDKSQPALFKELGDLYVQYQQPEKGIAAYKTRAEILESDAGWRELAQLYFYLKRFEEGLTVMHTLAEQINTPQTWQTLGNLYFHYNFEQKGFEVFLKRAKQLKTLEAWKELAQLYFSKKQYNEGFAIYEQLPEQHQSIALRKELAELYVHYGLAQKAIERYHQQALLNDTEQSWKTLAQLYLAQEMLKDGLEVYLKLAKRENTPTLWKELATLNFYYGLDAAGMEALEQYTRLINTTEAWKALAHLYLNKKMTSQGLATYLRIATYEKNPALWKETGDLHFHYGIVDKGLEAYAFRARLLNNDQTWKELTQLYLSHQEVEQGLDIFQKLAKQKNSPESWKELSELYFYFGRVPGGLEAYYHYAVLQNTEAIWKHLGQLYLTHQLFDQGLNIYSQLANISNQASTWKELAVLYYWQKRPSEGDTALAKAVELDPSFKTLPVLAYRLEAQGKLDEAEALYIQALPLRAEPLNGERELIKFYSRQGQVQKANHRMTQVRQHYQGVSTEDLNLALKLAIESSEPKTAMRLLSRIKVQDLPFENIRNYYELSVSRGDLGKAEEILTFWERQSALPHLWREHFNLEKLKGQPGEAAKILKRVLQTQEETLKRLAELYEFYAAMSDREGQKESLRTILLRYPENMEWLEKALKFYLFYQAYEEGVNLLTQRYTLMPSKPNLKALIRLLIAARQGENAQNRLKAMPDIYWDQEFVDLAIDVGYLNSDYLWMIPYLEKRFSHNHALEDFRALVGAFKAIGNSERELYYYQKMLAVHPTLPNRIDYVQALLRAECQAQALEETQKIAQGPLTSTQIQTLANLAEGFPKPELALELYGRLLPTPFKKTGIEKMVEILRAHQRHEEAMPLIQQYLQEVPQSLKMRLWLAQSQMATQSPLTDSPFFEELARSLAKKNQPTYEEKQALLLGFLLTDQEQTLIEKVQTYAPQDHFKALLVWLIETLIQHKNDKWLLNVLQFYPKDNPRWTEYFSYKYNAEYRLGMKNEAFETLTQWAQYDLQNIQVWKNLAFIYSEQNDKIQSLQADGKVQRLTQLSQVRLPLQALTSKDNNPNKVFAFNAKSTNTCP
ncbi:hypothetical protein WDW89_22430 [Deltaproteobacteria bacterium TL4]